MNLEHEVDVVDTEVTETQTQEDLEKAAAKAQKAAEKAAKAEARKADVAARREATKAAKERMKAERIAARQEKKAAKEQQKTQQGVAREANRQPMQNGVRRPKPEGKCGRTWAIFDSISFETGAPATIAAALEVSRSQELNDANTRCEFARWRQFNGLTTSRVKPAVQEEQAVAAE